MSPLLQERDGAVAVLRLNRPEARNALDVALMTALRDTLAELANDDSVRAVVLTGNGEAFCAGLDLVDLETTGANLELGGSHTDGTPNSPWVSFPKPLIGAIKWPGGDRRAGARPRLRLPRRLRGRLLGRHAQPGRRDARVGLLPLAGRHRQHPRRRAGRRGGGGAGAGDPSTPARGCSSAGRSAASRPSSSTWWTCTSRSSTHARRVPRVVGGEPGRRGRPAAGAGSLAFTVASRAARQVTRAPVQVHGGIDFTWGHPAHRHLKTAMNNTVLAGGTQAHERRLAGLALAPTGTDVSR